MLKIKIINQTATIIFTKDAYLTIADIGVIKVSFIKSTCLTIINANIA